MKAKSAFAIAPRSAETAKTWRVLKTSGKLRSALIKVPATNPICTDSVSHDVVAMPRCHSRAICGAAADAANQSDMPRSSASASSSSARNGAALHATEHEQGDGPGCRTIAIRTASAANRVRVASERTEAPRLQHRADVVAHRIQPAIHDGALEHEFLEGAPFERRTAA